MSTEEAKKQSEQISGISNVAYDLMAVLYNKAEGIAAIEAYKMDAEEDGDQEVQDLFDRIQQEETRHIEQLKNLLIQRLK